MKNILFETNDLLISSIKSSFQLNISIGEKEKLGLFGQELDELEIIFDFLTLIDKPTKGNIYYKSKKINALSAEEQKKLRSLEIGIANTKYLDLDMTVIDFVTLANYKLKEQKTSKNLRINNLLNFFSLEMRSSSMIKDLNAYELEKLTLLTAIVNSPKIMIYLDVEEKLSKSEINEISKTIESINHVKGISIVHLSNSINRLHATKIIKLKNNKI